MKNWFLIMVDDEGWATILQKFYTYNQCLIYFKKEYINKNKDIEKIDEYQYKDNRFGDFYNIVQY